VVKLSDWGLSSLHPAVYETDEETYRSEFKIDSLLLDITFLFRVIDYFNFRSHLRDSKMVW